MNKHLYTDELTQSLNLEKAEELETMLLQWEADWERASERLGEKKVIDLFVRFLDKNGWNMWIIKAIRSLLGKGKC